MPTAVLRVRRLTKRYRLGPKQWRAVFEGINLTVRAGELVSCVGINGAGKSTLLKLLVGLARPSAGSVLVGGRPVGEPLARANLGYMPENPQFYPDITGADLLRLVGRLRRVPKKTLKEKIPSLLADAGLSGAARTPLRHYSKGMRQRLAFAQAVIGNPTLLLLDEPFDGLDPVGRRELKNQLLTLKKKGVAVLLCSHILSDLGELSDRVLLLHAGRLAPLEKAGSLETAFISQVNKK